MQEFVPIKQPHELSYKEKERGMTAYFMMFAAGTIGLPMPIINLLASLLYHYFVASTSRFVKFHSYQSLVSQLPITVLNLITVIWGFQIIFNDALFTDLFKGFLVVVVVSNLIYTIFSVIAAIKAYKGRMYYFIFFGKIAYMWAYKVNPNQKTNNISQNAPPTI